MFYATNTYTVTGGVDIFTLSFSGVYPGYVDTSHIQYYVGGIKQDPANLTFLTPTSVQVSPLPIDGAVITFRRETSLETSLVDWQSRQAVTEVNLDLNTTQLLYLAQEVSDLVGDQASSAATSALEALISETNAGIQAAAALASANYSSDSAAAALASEDAALDSENMAEYYAGRADASVKTLFSARYRVTVPAGGQTVFATDLPINGTIPNVQLLADGIMQNDAFACDVSGNATTGWTEYVNAGSTLPEGTDVMVLSITPVALPDMTQAVTDLAFAANALSTTTLPFDTIADMRSSGSGRANGVYSVKGHSAVGDGGSGDFVFFVGELPGTYIDDNVVTVVPAGGDGSAAWVMHSGRIINDLTVNIPADYTSLQEAINTLSLRLDVKQGVVVNLNIQSGHKLTAGLSLKRGDYSFFKIISDDACVYVDPEFTPVDSSRIPGSNNSLFYFEDCRAPILSTIIDGEDTTSFDGMMVFRNCIVSVEEECGCQGFRINLEVRDSRFSGRYTHWDRADRECVRLTMNTQFNIVYATMCDGWRDVNGSESLNSSFASLHISRGSIGNAQNCIIERSGASHINIRRSFVYLEDTILNLKNYAGHSSGSYAISFQDGGNCIGLPIVDGNPMEPTDTPLGLFNVTHGEGIVYDAGSPAVVTSEILSSGNGFCTLFANGLMTLIYNPASFDLTANTITTVSNGGATSNFIDSDIVSVSISVEPDLGSASRLVACAGIGVGFSTINQEFLLASGVSVSDVRCVLKASGRWY